MIRRCRTHSPDTHVIFVESICDDAQVLETNFMQKVSNSPDYKDMPLEDAMVDLRCVVQRHSAEPVNVGLRV